MTEKLTITFTKPERGFAKDCWIVESPADAESEHSGEEEAEKENKDKEDPGTTVMTICKSSTDEYLNGDCVTLKPDENYKIVPIQTRSTKIKAQEIDLNYPCLVSNVGLSSLMIQSLTCPE